MTHHMKALFLAAVLTCLLPAGAMAGITAFSQDFEGLDAADLDALGDDGWIVYANVFAAGSGGFLYGYGPFPAPNNPAAPAFSSIAVGEGGAEQGAQQLSVFSDYENGTAHDAGDVIEANVFKEFTVDASDVGKVCSFEFQAKLGTLVAPSTALAFIKTIDPADSYAQTNFVNVDLTGITSEWGGYSLQLTIDAGLIGQFFQVGFSNNATNFDGSSIFYDNVVLSTDGGSEPTTMDPYSQDFESLNPANTTALGDDGWLVYANVFAFGSGDFLYDYGPNPAPNNPGSPAFCNLVTGEGGPDQGDIQLLVLNDYENAEAHGAGDLVEAIVYREQTINAGDVGKTWVFEFNAKLPANGAVTAPSTAEAFIKTINPAAGYTVTNYITEDMAAISTNWGGYSLSLTIDAELVGQFFQIGFVNTATFYGPSGVVYDNVNLFMDASPVPDASDLMGATLGQNYPNPFNPLTRIDFSLEKAAFVDLAVYDVKGRLVATLLHSDLSAGDHSVTWNGQNRSGSPAAAGQYYYVMKTAAGQLSRSMILLK